jgi:hypothetical protein
MEEEEAGVEVEEAAVVVTVHTAGPSRLLPGSQEVPPQPLLAPTMLLSMPSTTVARIRTPPMGVTTTTCACTTSTISKRLVAILSRPLQGPQRARPVLPEVPLVLLELL